MLKEEYIKWCEKNGKTLSRSQSNVSNIIRVEKACLEVGWWSLDQQYIKWVITNKFKKNYPPVLSKDGPTAFAKVFNALNGHGGYTLDPHLEVDSNPVSQGVRADLKTALRSYYRFCLEHHGVVSLVPS